MTDSSAAGAGIAHFDAVAASWDERDAGTRTSRAVATAILEQLTLDGSQRAMELGCGTGLVTAMLAPRLASVLAVDSSPGMLAVLRDKLVELDLENVEPLEADLSRDIPAGPFDLIFSSMTLHHIDNVPGLLERLFDALSPGGQLALADLEKEDGSFHGDEVPGVYHHGFEAAELTAWLRQAGFEQAQARVIHHIRRETDDGSARAYPVLLATARKPADADPGRPNRAA